MIYGSSEDIIMKTVENDKYPNGALNIHNVYFFGAGPRGPLPRGSYETALRAVNRAIKDIRNGNIRLYSNLNRITALTVAELYSHKKYLEEQLGVKDE